MSSVNIASHLSAMAARRPNDIAIYCATGGNPGDTDSYDRMTYAELDQRSDEIAAGLLAIGLKRGDRSALMVKPGLNLFALTFALFKAGIVPVLIDPGIGLKNIKGCIARSKPTAFIGIPPAHAARIVLGWGRDTLTHLVTVGRRLGWGGVSLDEVIAAGRAKPVPMAETTADEIAAILFTSGSTGPPKGAICRHKNFAAQVAAIRDMFGIREGEVNVPTFPLFALFDPALGMTSVIPDMDASRPAKVYVWLSGAAQHGEPLGRGARFEDAHASSYHGRRRACARTGDAPHARAYLARWRALPALRRHRVAARRHDVQQRDFGGDLGGDRAGRRRLRGPACAEYPTARHRHRRRRDRRPSLGDGLCGWRGRRNRGLRRRRDHRLPA
jgi:hypothetical protein